MGDSVEHLTTLLSCSHTLEAEEGETHMQKVHLSDSSFLLSFSKGLGQMDSKVSSGLKMLLLVIIPELP